MAWGLRTPVRHLLNLVPQEEAARQNRLQKALERAHGRAFAAEIARAMGEMLASYRATGSAPNLPDDHEAKLRAVMQVMAEQSIATFGARILEQGKAQQPGLEVKVFAEFFQRLALEFIGMEMVRQRITAIANTTRRQMVSMISRGQEQGESLDTIARDINRKTPRISRWRAAMIARTEVHSAANHGAHNAAKATGLPLAKQWVSVEDTRIRDFNEPTIAEFDHRRMDEVTVAMDEPFMVPRRGGGYEALMHPGDPAGSAGNIINCRCAIAHVVLE